ncbi:MAG: hypothetical protein RLZZ500_2456 [Bacteroidota bacterium]|jgi:hypothetical protein
MKSKSFNITKLNAFDTCKKVLNECDYTIISSDFSNGEIEAKKGGNFLSYGHKLIITIKSTDSGKAKISVSSSSIGIQIIDWGTNAENEDELIDLISNSIR